MKQFIGKIKPIYIFIFLFFVGIVVVFLFSRGLTNKNSTIPTPPLAASPSVSIPPPLFPAPVSSLKTYNLSFVPSEKKQEVSVLRYEHPRDLLTTAKNVATWFLMGGEPVKTQLTEGALYVFSSGEKSLSVGLDPIVVSYRVYPKNNLSPLLFTDNEMVQLAENFIQKNNILPRGTTLSSPTISYLSPKKSDPNHTSRDKATTIRISYDILFSGHIVTTKNLGEPGLSITIDSTKEIVGFTGLYFPALSSGGQTLSVVSPSEAVVRLQTGNGVLASVSSIEDINKEDPPRYVFSAISVAGVTLGYYYTSKQPILAPVYLYKGEARDKKNRAVNTVSIVSALPSPSP